VQLLQNALVADLATGPLLSLVFLASPPEISNCVRWREWRLEVFKRSASRRDAFYGRRETLGRYSEFQSGLRSKSLSRSTTSWTLIAIDAGFWYSTDGTQSI